VSSYPWLSTFLTDTRETVAPSRGSKDGLLPPLLVALTVVTGLVDAFSYLVLGHVFVANMTGNVVFFAFALAGVGGFSATASVTAIGCFALGALAGTLIAGSMPQPRHRSWILTGVAFALGVGLILLGLAPSVGVALLVTVPMGLAGGLINVLLISWLQARTEAAMLGRVMSLVMLASVGLAPISLAAAGLLVDGAVVPLFVGAGGIVLAAAAFGVVSGAAHRLD